MSVIKSGFELAIPIRGLGQILRRHYATVGLGLILALGSAGPAAAAVIPGSMVSATCPPQAELGAPVPVLVTVHNPTNGVDWDCQYPYSWAQSAQYLSWTTNQSYLSWHIDVYASSNDIVRKGQTVTSTLLITNVPTALGSNGAYIYAWQRSVNQSGSCDWVNITNQGRLISFEVVAAVPPTIALSSPSGPARTWSNQFVLSGTAADNVQLAAVWWELGTNTYQAQTTNGWTNWWAEVPLQIGTNWVRVHSTDMAKLSSQVLTQQVYRVPISPIALLTNGWGSILGASNGQVLEVGTSYTLTAVPVPGFAFAHWTEGPSNVVSQTAAYPFLMQSNLALTATFVDVQGPLLQVTSPTNGQRITGTTLVVRGTAYDNIETHQVWSWMDDSPGGDCAGFEEWTSTTIELGPGTNYFHVWAMDSSGNFSPTLTLRFVPAPSPESGYIVQAEAMIEWALRPTFNLVAIPFAGTGLTTAESVANFVPACGGVWKWDATSQGWSGHRPAGPNNFALNAGDALLVSVTNAGLMTLTGSWPATPTSLKPGYNLLCVPASHSGVGLAEDLVKSISTCTGIWKWDATSQGWSGHRQGGPNNFAVETGRAYLVYVTSGSSW